MRSLELTVDTYKFEVPVFQQDGKNWVALRQLCEALGVDPDTQRRKVEVNPEITCGHMTLRDSKGRQQEMFCIQIDHVGLWLYGINPNKVKPEIREKMYVFRQKLISVLYATVTGHLDPNMVHSLLQEMKKMNTTIAHLQKDNHELREQNATLRTSVDYLLRKDVLNENYVDKQLASVGGKLLSNLSQKRRKTPEVF